MADGRTKALIAVGAGATLVVAAVVVATAGGGSDKPSAKADPPKVGLAGDPAGISETSSSPWIWETSQSMAKTTGATSSTASSPASSSSLPTTPSATGVSTTSAATSAPSAPGASSRSPSAPAASTSGPVAPPSTPAGSPPAPVKTVDLLTGPGCPSPAGGGYSSIGSGSSSGWGSNGSGGWTGNGCNGAMQSMPMSGDATNHDNRALWWFGGGTAGFTACTVSVYVPWDGKATDTGGTAAGYQLADSSDVVMANFTVDQNASHGQWVTLGTVAVGGKSVKLRLLDHGIDYPAGWRYGVSAAKLHCTG